MVWTAPADRDRGLGALWGLALGDALGTTLELTTPAPVGFPAPAPAPAGRSDSVGGGPFRLAPLDEAAARLDATGDDRDGITAAHAARASDLAAAEADDPQLYTAALHLHAHLGFVRVGFRLAFWTLAHASDHPTALVELCE